VFDVQKLSINKPAIQLINQIRTIDPTNADADVYSAVG